MCIGGIIFGQFEKTWLHVTMNSSDLLTIRGYVQMLPSVPGSDDVARVALVADDGQTYSVLHRGEGVGLLKNINANVEITGNFVQQNVEDDIEDGQPSRLLEVKSFRLTDGYDDPWYDDTAD